MRIYSGISTHSVGNGRVQVCLESHNHDSLGEALRTVSATGAQVKAALKGYTVGGTRAARRAQILARLNQIFPRNLDARLAAKGWIKDRKDG